MKGWQNLKIEMLCDSENAFVQTGPFGSQLHESDYSKDGIPVIMPRNIANGKIVTTSIARVSEKHVQRLKRHKVLPGDIVYGRRGDIGRQALIRNNEKGWLCGTGCLLIRLNKEKADTFFIHYYLSQQPVIDYVTNQAVGATMPNLNTAILSNVPIYLPPLPIQRKIAAILSAYDDLIENNNRRIAILEKMAEELYREWFVRLRFPGHEKVKIVKGVPEGWDVNELSTVCFEKRILVKKENISDSTKYVGLEHITPHSMIIKEHGYAIDIQSNKLFFSFGDILFGKIRPYLHKVAVSHFGGVCSSDTIVVKVDKKECQAFAYLTISSDSFIDLATTSSTGTKMPRADWDFLKKQRMLIPNHSLLQQFQKLFDVYFGAIINYQRRNDLLTTSRDRLLSRLMSGKIDVENLDIRFPASMQEEEASAHA